MAYLKNFHDKNGIELAYDKELWHLDRCLYTCESEIYKIKRNLHYKEIVFETRVDKLLAMNYKTSTLQELENALIPSIELFNIERDQYEASFNTYNRLMVEREEIIIKILIRLKELKNENIVSKTLNELQNPKPAKKYNDIVLEPYSKKTEKFNNDRRMKERLKELESKSVIKVVKSKKQKKPTFEKGETK